jgi:glycosyltransferase involved in cell wall biosynthesis
MEISIIIPSYNTQDYIEDTLWHLVQQNINLTYEIIVVDCSEHKNVDRIVRRIKKSFDNIRCVYQATRFNPGEGRNIGAHEALGELLVFIDADVWLEPESLSAAWKHFQNGKKIFGGSLELNTSAATGLASYIEHYFFNHESQMNRPACERKNLSSALLCIDKKIFLHAGGFKDIPRMQDTELTERLKKNGHLLFFCPDILAFQMQNSPWSGVLKKIYIAGQNTYYIRYQPSTTLFKKIMFVAALPLITLLKIGRIIVRHLRYQTASGKAVTIAIGFPLLLASWFWMAGFYSALITEKGISPER